MAGSKKKKLNAKNVSVSSSKTIGKWIIRMHIPSEFPGGKRFFQVVTMEIDGIVNTDGKKKEMKALVEKAVLEKYNVGIDGVIFFGLY